MADEGRNPFQGSGADTGTGNAGTSGTRRILDDEARLAARLEGLDKSLRDKQRAEAKREGGKPSSGYAEAVKLASEFVAGVIVGAGIGWLVDRALGSSPWGLIVFLLLGFAAGVLNVLRSQGKVAEPGNRTGGRGGGQS